MRNGYSACQRFIVRHAAQAAVAMLAACARPVPPAPGPTADAELAQPMAPGAQTGTVVSLRPLDGAGDAHRDVLGALGGRAVPDAAARVEIVIRLADGQTVALVQRTEPPLRPGDRVALSAGSSRVARLGN